jgi:hypothetical protein
LPISISFYFNRELAECKYFFFGGCNGNGNNFEKLEECEKRCGTKKPSSSSATTVSAGVPSTGAPGSGTPGSSDASPGFTPVTQAVPPVIRESSTGRPLLLPPPDNSVDTTYLPGDRCNHPKLVRDYSSIVEEFILPKF